MAERERTLGNGVEDEDGLGRPECKHDLCVLNIILMSEQHLTRRLVDDDDVGGETMLLHWGEGTKKPAIQGPGLLISVPDS